MTDHLTLKRRAAQLRLDQTPAERVLWQRLRLRQLAGTRFLRQYVAGNFILDFYAPSIRLGIELDGGQHYEPDAVAYDAWRSEWLAAHGIAVLRYTNLDVSQRIAGVMDDIAAAVARWQAHPTGATRSRCARVRYAPPFVPKEVRCRLASSPFRRKGD